MTKFWTLEDMPSQKGRTIVVTGTGGLGFEDAVALARAGGDVIIAGRNPAKGAEAIRRIRQDVPNASVNFRGNRPWRPWVDCGFQPAVKG